MIPASTSSGKKAFLAILFLIVAATGAVFFFSKQHTTLQQAPAPAPLQPSAHLIDSATLIRHFAYLTTDAMAGRETGTPGNLLAQQYIVHIFDSLQLSKTGDSYLQPFSFNNIQGNNVIGMLKGSEYPDTYLVISAHYDHLGIRNGTIYYGADDNASGSAALLTLAQYFKNHPPKHSIIFAAFDAEEKGLRGSNYFVEHSPVPLTSIQVDLNMDMVSRNDNHEIYASGIFHYPFLEQYVDSIQKTAAVRVLKGHDDRSKGAHDDWTNQSDHYAFHKQKIPFLYFGVEDHPDYHKPSDTFDKVDKQFYYRVCTMIAQTALLLDRQEKLQ